MLYVDNAVGGIWRDAAGRSLPARLLTFRASASGSMLPVLLCNFHLATPPIGVCAHLRSSSMMVLAGVYCPGNFSHTNCGKGRAA